MGNPFDTLGLTPHFALSREVLEQRHRDLSRALHPDRHAGAPPAERALLAHRAADVNDALRALRDPFLRASALLSLHGSALSDADRPPQAMLLEVLELREALEFARGDPARVASLRGRVEALALSEENTLGGVFNGASTPPPVALERAREAAVKLRYYRRFLDEADALEDG
jgi:molecular chaperone HscB